MPLISIIIPVYNAERFLQRCMDSILAQTEKNFEVILSDDGSTDNSLLLCQQYSQKYVFIKVIHHTNRGPAHARNIALSQAKGEYITFVDADDWLSPGFLSELLHISNKYDADLTCCNLFLSYTNGDFCSVKPPRSEGIIERQTAILLGITDLGFGAFLWNKLFKRSLFDNFKMREDTFYEDYDAGIRLLARAQKIAYTPKPLYFYFQGNPNSTTHTFSLNKTRDHLYVSQDIVDFCAQHSWPQAEYAARIRMVDVAISLLHLLYQQNLFKQEQREVAQIRNILQKNKKILYSKIRFKKRLFGLLFLYAPFLLYLRNK